MSANYTNGIVGLDKIDLIYLPTDLDVQNKINELISKLNILIDYVTKEVNRK